MTSAAEKMARAINRREFLTAAGMGGLAVVGTSPLARDPSSRAVGPLPPDAADVMSPNEDLMQEHALLNRVLLIYEEAVRRLEGGILLDPEILKKSALIIRHFIEQYHEKLEEDFVFPRFEKAGKLLDLVSVLRVQHKAGRALTDRIISRATPPSIAGAADRKNLVADLSSFIRMYRPHESREGSVLFPAFRDLIPGREFQELGDMFEKKEHELLGPGGFEGQVAAVAAIESQLGTYELSRFSPATPDH